MTFTDLLRMSFAAIAGARTRSLLIVCAMALGVAAVVVLTALGEGARRYVVDQFASLGTNLLIVLPGRAETAGGFPGAALGQTPRDLSHADARAVAGLPGVRRVAPINVGLAELTAAGRLKEVTVLGGTPELLAVRHMRLTQGSFPGHGAHAVLGSRLAAEFFSAGGALGKGLRLGDRRFRVSGVLAVQGESLGFNSDEIVIIPVRDAQALFNTQSFFRILVEAGSSGAVGPLRREIRRTITLRHDGEEDVTIITQDAVLATFNRILRALTLGVAGIAAISLAVAGILVMNVMLVSVSQRRAEIGLLKAIGAPVAVVRRLFVAEALWLSLTGAVFGFALGHLGSLAVRLAYPQILAHPPVWAIVAAVATALSSGVLASLLPASRAAALDPVRALSGR